MKKAIIALVLLAMASLSAVWADVTLNIQLNFFGSPAQEAKGASVTTSFYLKSMVQRNLQVPFSAEALMAELKKTFNAPRVTLLAKGDLTWKSGGEPSVSQIVQINGRDLALVLTPLPRPGVVNFKIGVVEDNNAQSLKTILLDTEIVLPDGEVAMLGFRDGQENSYFIAFCVQNRQETPRPGVKRLNAAQAPRKIRDAKPVFPEEARKGNVQGVVMGVVETDASGRVSHAEVISGHPLFNDAALAAVRQWVFEPYRVDGKAVPVSFTFTVKFMIPNGSASGGKVAPDAADRLKDAKKPKLIKKVNPAYPPQAMTNGIEGTVVIEATIDELGKVRQMRVVSSTPELLNKAAMEAVKQWEYQPMVKDGKAVPVTFTVTVTFSLGKD